MNTYKKIHLLVKEQLKGNYVWLFLYLTVITLGFMLISDGMATFLGSQSTMYTILSFTLSLINILINAALAFLFLRYARKEAFGKEDVLFALKQALYLIATGILLSFLRYLFSYLTIFFSVIPILYILIFAIVYLFFVAWNVIVNFGIFDGNIKFSELIVGSGKLMFQFIGPFLLTGLLFIVWFALGQILVPAIAETLTNTTPYAGMMPSLMSASQLGMGTLAGMAVLHLVYYGVQFFLMVPVYMFCATIYDMNKDVCMPSGNRFASGLKKHK